MTMVQATANSWMVSRLDYWHSANSFTVKMLLKFHNIIILLYNVSHLLHYLPLGFTKSSD